jgi:hypothetical protein
MYAKFCNLKINQNGFIANLPTSMPSFSLNH